MAGRAERSREEGKYPSGAVPSTRACVDPGALLSRFVPDAQEIRGIDSRKEGKEKRKEKSQRSGVWRASMMVVINQW